MSQMHIFVESLEDRRLLSVGQLDPTFGKSGQVDLTRPVYEAPFLFSKPNGQLIVAGDLRSNGFHAPETFSIAEYTADGKLDRNFGKQGRTTLVLPADGAENFVDDMAMLPDGSSMLLIGRYKQPQTTFSLMRLKLDGSVDQHFGDDGRVALATNLAFFTAIARLIALPDGSMILGANPSDSLSSPSHFALFKLHPDGAIDSTFGHGGVVMTNSGSSSVLRQILVRADSKLLAVGTSEQGNVVVRYTPDGDIDSTFGHAGQEVFAGVRGDMADAALGPDGSIVIAGRYPARVARLRPDGHVDKGFGNVGLATVSYARGGTFFLQRILVDSTGHVLLSAVNSQHDLQSIAAIRLTPIGAKDASFSDEGRVVAKVGANVAPFYEYQSAIIQPGGKFVVAGEGQMLARFNTNGTLDRTFGKNGIALTDPTGKYGSLDVVEVLKNGKILAAGQTPSLFNDQNILLAQFNANGSDDTTFGGGDGRVVVDLGFKESAIGMAVGVDGKIVVLAHTENFAADQEPRSVVLRFNADGSLDSTFGKGGMVRLASLDASAIAVQSDGKIVVGGTVGIWEVMRLKTNGALDPTFADHGISNIPSLPYGDTTPVGEDGVLALLIKPDGKILAGGTFYFDSPGSVYALVQYNRDGTLDRHFADGGENLSPIADAFTDDRAITALALAPNGDIVAGGYDVSTPTVRRYLPNGALDTRFAGHGTYFYSQVDSGTDEGVAAVASASDGSVIALQLSETYGSNTLVRLTPRGTVDKTFGDAAQINGAYEDFLADLQPHFRDLALAKDGKIITVGDEVRRYLP